MEDRSTIEILTKTMPMIWVRIVANVIKILSALIVVGVFLLVGSIMTKSSNGKFDPSALYIIAAIVISLLIYFINHWAMYLIKAGHVSVISYYMLYGVLPKEGQIEYAMRTVKKHFISTKTGFGFDILIKGATNQGVALFSNIGELLGYFPGMGGLASIMKLFIRTVTSYADEIVIAHICISSDEGDIWKKATDGIVLYVQSWKVIFRASIKVLIGILVFKTFMLFMMIGILTPHLGEKTFLLQVILAILIWIFLSAVFIEPIVSIIMIKEYLYVTSQCLVSHDFYHNINSCSPKFREIVSKSVY
jgi:hypothetical protein